MDEYIQTSPIPSRHNLVRSTHKAGQALWLYYRFSLSHRDIEDLLAERGIVVSRESIRFWYGEIVDMHLQVKRDGGAAKRFFKRILRSHDGDPRKIVTDKRRSYGVAYRELIPDTIYSTQQYENNRAEQPQSLPRFMGMRLPGCVSQGCGDSIPLPKLNDLWQRTLPYPISSTSEGIWLEQSIAVILG